MPKYFDVHSHLNTDTFSGDIEEVVGRLKETDTHTIAVGVDFETSKRAVELAEKYEEIYAAVGIHPVDDPSASWEVNKFNKLISNPKVVAIGECGFDFYHRDKNTDFERQKKLFLAQVEFALKHNKLLMIHARNAYEELLEILEPLKGKVLGNIHFFAGSVEVAKRFFDLGFTISFTGVITFAHDYDDVIKSSPLNMIMSETDSPYVAPVPYRGKRNEPSFVSEVTRAVAKIRGEEEEMVRATLVNNALRMIG